jgi:hypothetical protein
MYVSAHIADGYIAAYACINMHIHACITKHTHTQSIHIHTFQASTPIDPVKAKAAFRKHAKLSASGEVFGSRESMKNLLPPVGEFGSSLHLLCMQCRRAI